MANYLLYDKKIIDDDSSIKNFAKSLLKDLDKDYEIEKSKCSKQEFKDKMLEAVNEVIIYDLSRTDINYAELMLKYSGDIGPLLYKMEDLGCDISSLSFSFFEEAQSSFESFIYLYIEVNFEHLISD